ncbi:MAG: hypothetical protein LV480_00030 [Methylacidiphilales bacterium]|nr:hypothetical protein [Candidatus Methylacidiphilales bacterium]
MKPMKLTTLAILTTLLFAGMAKAQQSSASERVAALKASVATSKIILQNYEWIQTTVVSLNGDVKSSKQERCYYGDDGTLQKVEIDDTSSQATGGPFMRRLKERKKAELTDYMKNAVNLVKSYVPPSAGKIQAAKDAGNVSVQPLSDRRARIVFQNYEKPGDSYSIEVNLENNRPVGLKVSTYLNDPSDTVTLTAAMGQLNNGTTYPAEITLNADSKGLTVTVHNSGYRRVN